MEGTAMKWYMTVGYPGGEYAAQNPHLLEDEVQEIQRSAGARNIAIRPCPPDLAEWIEAEMDAPQFAPGIDGYEALDRRKVPAGWLYYYTLTSDYVVKDVVINFVPVAGAGGLTVLGG